VSTHPALQAQIADAVAQANTRLARAEQVKAYAILADEWIPASHELTPTLKLKRHAIADKYAAEIEALYAEGCSRPTV
jgi:long-subunit acyl-CoA synthetase (AMP-forming)